MQVTSVNCRSTKMKRSAEKTFMQLWLYAENRARISEPNGEQKFATDGLDGVEQSAASMSDSIIGGIVCTAYN